MIGIFLAREFYGEYALMATQKLRAQSTVWINIGFIIFALNYSHEVWSSSYDVLVWPVLKENGELLDYKYCGLLNTICLCWMHALYLILKKKNPSNLGFNPQIGFSARVSPSDCIIYDIPLYNMWNIYCIIYESWAVDCIL